MTKKRKSWIASFGAVVVALLALAFWPGEKEPEYQGKKLSKWLEIGTRPRRTVAEQKAGELDINQAKEAVRQIGTNGLPYLTHAILSEPPRWLERMINSDFRIIASMGRYLNNRRDDRASTAEWGFEVLGPEAKNAAPTLAPFLLATSRIRVGRVAQALTAMGEDGTVELLTAIADRTGPRDIFVVAITIAALSSNPPSQKNAQKFVPGLLSLMGDNLQGSAASDILSTLYETKPDQYEPLLKSYLVQTNEIMRAAAATVLLKNTGLASQVRMEAERVLDSTSHEVREKMRPKTSADYRVF
jgi:hypothetical protein